MSNYHYAEPEYTTVPPPPEATYVVPPPPHSAFSPAAAAVPVNYNLPPIGYNDSYLRTQPIVVAASPSPSRPASRAAGEYIVPDRDDRERNYLAASTYGGSTAGRSSSSRRGREIQVEGPRTKKYYINDRYRDRDHDDRDDSDYSNSSYGDSRDHSRGPPPRDRDRDLSRGPRDGRPRDSVRTLAIAPVGGGRARSRSNASIQSGDSAMYEDDRYAVGVYRASQQEQELTEKLKEVQRQLEKVQVDAEKKRMQDEAIRLEKERNAEIERQVKEKIDAQRREEAEKARLEKEKLANEQKRIAEAAKKLLDEQAAAAAAAKAEEEKRKAEIAAIVAAERQKYSDAEAGKKTYTRFSKTHLCKEALEEQKIEFTEEHDYFLVHRFVEKAEQQYLWNRTKQIRAYYQQIQEAASKAPTVLGPNGGYVKYVQIAGQPYPMALPVTITHTPGGGQTQQLDPIKIKWSDIFRK